jgi:hypothetical protein
MDGALMDEIARQLRLVRLALTNGLRNCVHWVSEDLINRVRRDPDLLGLTPEGIVTLLIDWGRRGGEIRPVAGQVEESRAGFDHLFAVVIPVEGMPHALELYVKMGLHDDDEDYPEVAIVSCHRATFPRGPR